MPNPATRDIILKAAEAIPENTDDSPLEGLDTGADDAGTDEGAGDGDSGDAGVGEPAVGEPAADVPAVEDGTEAVADGVVADTGAVAAVEPAAEAPAAGADATGAAATKKAADLEAFAKEHGLGKDSKGRFNRVPHNIIAERIVPNAIKKARTDWEAKELQPALKLNAEYVQRLGSFKKTEDLMFGDATAQRQFVSILRTIPGWNDVFTQMGLKGEAEAAKAAVGTTLAPAAEDGTDPNDPMPTPDAKDDKGNIIGWTQEGMDKRMEWHERRAERRAVATAEKRVGEKLAPLTKRADSEAARAKDEAAIDGALDEAKGWPGFNENYEAILAKFTAGTDDVTTPAKMLSALDKAYKAIMFGVVTTAHATEEEKRKKYHEQWTKELNEAPRAATSTVGSVAREEPAVDASQQGSRTRSIIMDSLKRRKLI